MYTQSFRDSLHKHKCSELLFQQEISSLNLNTILCKIPAFLSSTLKASVVQAPVTATALIKGKSQYHLQPASLLTAVNFIKDLLPFCQHKAHLLS